MSLLNSGDIMRKISGLIGANQQSTDGAVKNAVPTMLGGLINKSSTPEGANSIIDMIKSGGYDGEALSNLSGLLNKGESTDNLLSKGASLLTGIFGDKSSDVTNQIASTSGISSESSSKLLGLLSPILMGVLGKEVSSNGLNASSLTSLLGDQGGFLKGLLPSWLTGILGLVSLDSITSGIKGAFGDTADAAKSVVSGTLDIGKNVVSGTTDAAKNIVTGTTDVVKDVAGGTLDMGKKVVSGTADMAKDVAGGTIDMSKKVVSGAVDMTRDVAQSGGSALKKLLPLILILIGALLIWTLWKGCNKETGVVSTTDSTTVSNLVDSAANAINNGATTNSDIKSNATDSSTNTPTAVVSNSGGKIDSVSGNFVYDVGNMTTINLPNGGGTIEVGENSFESKLYKFLSDQSMMVDTLDKTKGWMSLDRVYFETGKSVLIKESQKQVENIAAILKSFPSAKIKIGGYTDNSGSVATNMKVSSERAKMVLSQLVKLGSLKDNLMSEGYGPEHPVSSNDTPEGRAQNRRVDVRVTQK